MPPRLNTGSSGGSSSRTTDEDETRSSSSSSRSSNTQSSSRSRPRPPQKTDVGDTDESKETSSPDVNELLREAENIDKDGSTTSEHVDSSPSSGPPVHGGAGGSSPGEDPYEDPKPEDGGEWDPYDVGVNPGTPGLASGRETGSTGPEDDFESEVQGSDPREDVPGGPDGGEDDESWHDNWGFGEGRPGNEPELPELPDMPELPDGPEVNVSSKPLAYALVGVGLLWAGVSALGGGS